jgi:hypothetical protein
MVNTGSDGIFGYPDFFRITDMNTDIISDIEFEYNMSDIRRISNIRILFRINLLGYLIRIAVCILLIFCRNKLIIHKWPQKIMKIYGGIPYVHI